MWAAAYLIKEAAGMARLGRIERVARKGGTKYVAANKAYNDALGYDAKGHISVDKYNERMNLPEVVAAKQQQNELSAQHLEKMQTLYPILRSLSQRQVHRAAMTSPEKAKRMAGTAFETLTSGVPPENAAAVERAKSFIFGGQKLDAYTPMLQDMYRKQIASGSRTPMKDLSGIASSRLQAGVGSGQIDPAGVQDVWQGF